MGNAEDMARLAQEVANAYEERVNTINATKGATVNLLDDFDKAHQEMADNQRRELAEFKSDLDALEVERKKEDQAEVAQRAIDIENLLSDFDSVHQEMADNQHAELVKFKSDLDAAEAGRKKEDQAEVRQRSIDIENLLTDFDSAHQEMADNLRAELVKFKSDLDASEVDRKKEDQADVRQRAIDIENLLSDFDSAHQEMAEKLRAELDKVKPELEAAVTNMLNEFRKEREEAAAAWKGLLSDMASLREKVTITGFAGVEAAVEVATVDEAIKVEEPEEMELGEEVAEEDDLGDEIVSLLDDNPDGLRMVEIADVLGIESWRSLIPVMRELLDDDEVRKEDSTYYAV